MHRSCLHTSIDTPPTAQTCARHSCSAHRTSRNHCGVAATAVPPQMSYSQLTPVEATAVHVAYMRCKGCEALKAATGAAHYSPALDQQVVDLVKADDIPVKYTQGDFQNTMALWMGVRTAELDHQIQEACHDLEAPQIVILGAGLDPRAWRLNWPAGTAVYEVDTGSTEALKMAAWSEHSPNCKRVFIQSDVTAADLLDQLQAAGLDKDLPVVWLMEGLIGYLSKEHSNALLSTLQQNSSSGSKLVVTAPPTAEWRDEIQQRGIKLHHQVYEPPEDTLQRVLSAGWQARLLPNRTLAAKYNAPGYRQDFILGYKA